MRSLLLVLLAGCWSSSSPPAAVPTQAALPACPIELVDQHLRVAGADNNPDVAPGENIGSPIEGKYGCPSG